VTDATLVGWHKKAGDRVSRDENLVDLETDKVVLEVPAPADGVLKEIKVEDGATVTAGDLLESRQVHGISDIALIRIEQLYPFPVEEFAAVIEKYEHVEDVVWCQEEPQNQGAWYQIRHRLQEPLRDHQNLYYAGRPASAAPASGIFKVHLQQQQALVEAALDIEIKASKTAKPRKSKRKTK
jgi:2-oxoglutarate dehydrogenase complex dehydrogenase (E1) component-like enzyme